MNYLSPADWSIIVLYLLGICALGVWFGKDQRTTRDYFLGSKSIPWWGIGLSIVAAETSALTIIGVPGLAWGGDITFLQMVLGYVIGAQSSKPTPAPTSEKANDKPSDKSRDKPNENAR